MQEIELKFQIPAGALDAVTAAMRAHAGAAWAPWPLRAAYFDTPDRRLALARMALRVRQEGPDWVQTLKAGGSHTMMRLEDNCPTEAPAEGAPITAQLGLHRGRPAEQALTEVLNWSPQLDPHGLACGLGVRYGTDITRWRCHLAAGTGTPWAGEVELALDLGHIASGPLRLPVRELEIESVSGHPMAVIVAARAWVAQHGLWLDTQTKSHRGDRLAHQADAWRRAAPDEAEALATAWAQQPPMHDAGRPTPLRQAAAPTTQAEWLSQWSACVDQVAANLSEIATLAPAEPHAAATAWRAGLLQFVALGQTPSAPRGLDVDTPACNALQQVGQRSEAMAARLAEVLSPSNPASSADIVALARHGDATGLCLDALAIALQLG